MTLEETMKLTKHGLLAAVAAAALVAGAGSAVTQQQEKGMSGQGQAPSAQGGSELQGGAKAEKKGGAQTQMKDEGAKTQGQAEQPGAKQPGQAQQKPDAQPRGQVQQQPGAKEPGQAQQPGAKQQPGQAQQPGAKQQPGQAQDTKQRPGQAQESGAKGDAKSVQLSSEQRTKISTTIKQQTNLKRISRTEVNFTINVGAVVPRTVNLVVLPAPIVAVVPQWRGYLYIIVDDQLLIIHPSTYEIVAVLPA